MIPLILASQSPRRQELLRDMGLEFTVVPSRFDEQLDDDRSALEVAQELALGKAQAVADDNPHVAVIGSDTIVVSDGRQLGKPADEADARATLLKLAGTTCQIISSVAVVYGDKQWQRTGADTVTIEFKPADTKAIDAYLATGDYADKAGSFGVQSGAAPLIKMVRGHYVTVLGLPTHLLVGMLAELGIYAETADPKPPRDLYFE